MKAMIYKQIVKKLTKRLQRGKVPDKEQIL